jgi:cytokinin dehydrogenase
MSEESSAIDWPIFAGALFCKGERLSACASDFGRLNHAPPLAVLCPANVEDVVRAVHFARARGLGVVARGQGHTTRGQALLKGGIVVETAPLDRVLELVSSSAPPSTDARGGPSVRVEAGARWGSLLRQTLTAGLTPPVLTDYIDLSIGGTLSVGGLGGQSFRYGLQLDNVLELRVVTGRGEIVRCASDENAALFNACRGGLGQFGIIVEATLRLIPAPESVHVYHLVYADLNSFLRAQRLLIKDGRFDYVLGNILPRRGDIEEPWEFSVECVHYWGGTYEERGEASLLSGLDFVGEPRRATLGYFEYANRLAAMVEALKRTGSWDGYHPWIDLFVPASQSRSLIASALAELTHDEVGDGYVMTYPLLRHRCQSVFPGLPNEDFFLFDVLPFIPARDELRVGFERKCGRIYAEARKCGGTIYPIGFPIGTKSLTRDDWQQQFGANWGGLVALKKQHDPDGILNPGLGLF